MEENEPTAPQRRRLQEGLEQKRRNLTVWLTTTPVQNRELRLGPADEQQVREHLHVIDDALQKAADGLLGVCRICGQFVGEDLIEMDYTAQVCLGHLSETEARQLERELELSSVVQRALLPQEAPQIPGFELAAFSQAAHIVSGDFFDFLQFGNGAYGFLIADVVGKGVSAGLVMASLQTALRALVPLGTSPADVLAGINRLLAHNIRFSIFATLFLAAYDPTTRTLTYCNSGHNPPLLLRTDGDGRCELHTLPPTGAAIGLIEDPQLQDQTIELAPGDLLLLFTDGVVEAFDSRREVYGTPRLAAFLQQNSTARPKALIQELWRELSRFAGGRPLEDDVTVIACRVYDESQA